MKYSPKKFDTAIRAIYSIALISSFVIMMIPAKGALSSVLSSVALLLLGVSLMLFIKYDATKYEYILLERNGTFDFYVNKINGRRGAYVCYFPISDCVAHGEFGDTTRTELNAKYNSCSFSKYVQNFLSGKKYTVMNQNIRSIQAVKVSTLRKSSVKGGFLSCFVSILYHKKRVLSMKK